MIFGEKQHGLFEKSLEEKIDDYFLLKILLLFTI